MKRSEQRILTTHIGSLQRPPELLKMLVAQQERETVQQPAFDDAVSSAVADAARHQVEAGISVINDGEMGRASYATYIADRLRGFDGPENPRRLYSTPSDAETFPEWSERWIAVQKYEVSRRSCNGPVSSGDPAIIRGEIARLKQAASEFDVDEIFMTAISPASVANNHPNQYYKTQTEYLEAIATALKAEYTEIVNAGIILQIDCVDLGGRRPAGSNLEDLRRDRAQKIDLINQTTRDLPPERMRLHVCWGAMEQPHYTDAELKDFVDILLTARPAGLMVPGANGRHRHEWEVWQGLKLPEGKVLIPGVIDNTTNIIEHPETVAERIVRYANAVGRENVIAGVDCGFSSNINIDEVDSEIAWAKLRALADGADLATQHLWAS